MADVKISALTPVASVGDADLFEVVQGGTNRSATAAQLRASDGAARRLTWSDNGAALGPTYEAFRDSASPAGNDLLGGLALIGRDSAGNETVYGRLHGMILIPTDSAEYGRLMGRVAIAGVETPAFQADLNGFEVLLGALRMNGAEVVTAQRHLTLRSYTLAQLSTLTGDVSTIIWCSDLGGGAGALIGVGSGIGLGYSRLTHRGIQLVNTDADFTIEALRDAPTILHTGTLTANRTITLGTTQAYPGAPFRVTRTGASSFNLSVGGLKALATNTWADFEYFSGAWRLTAYGTL